MASEEDKKMAESWKDDADGILIFVRRYRLCPQLLLLIRHTQTGLFSAAVASLISVSIQDLQQNPQDTSNFYLANTYQATINPNASSSLPTSPPPFTPPNYAIWVNGLWFLSLVISITCALLATLLQQWARRYLKVTQPRYSPHKRARIRAFFAEGVDKFLLPWAVEALPTMLHLSLFLFFAGLAVFLWNVNLTIFKLVLSWIGLCTALYGCITFLPILHHDCPYHTPLSLPVWHFVTGIQLLTFRALKWITLSFDYFSYRTYDRFRNLAEGYVRSLVRGMQKTAEESAFNSPLEIVTRAFMWTFDCLDEDHELERFFAGLPGFRSSKMVHDPLPDLSSEQQEKLLQALIGLADRTSSSDLLPEQVKIRRTVICRRAIGPADIPNAIWRAFHRFTSADQYGLVQSAEIADLVRGWENGEDEETTMITRATVSSVVARAQRHDDLWFTLASKEMSVSESVLRNYATHGNSLSLAILNHVVRQQFSFVEQGHWVLYVFLKILEAASKFDVLDTSPKLQHEFCALWNQVVRADHVLPRHILGPIRDVYLTLHQHTDCAPTEFSASTIDEDPMLKYPSTYPLCKIPDHHPHPTTPIHDVSASTAIPRPVPQDNTALDPTFPPDASSLSVATPVLVDEKTVDVPQVTNILVSASSSSCALQTATEIFHDSETSPDPTAAVDARDNPSARTMALTIREISTSTTSAPPPSEVSFQNNANLLVPHSTSPENPPSTSLEIVLENMLPKGTPPNIPCPNLTDQRSYPESHFSIIASAYPSTSPWPTSAVAATSDEGSPKPSLREDKHALDLPPVDRTSQATTQSNVDALPQLLPPPSVTDIATASLSHQEFDAEHARDPHDDTV